MNGRINKITSVNSETITMIMPVVSVVSFWNGK